MEKQAQNKSNKRKTVKKIIITLFSLILIVVLSYTGYTFYQLDQAADKSYQTLERSGNMSVKRKQPITIGTNPISILLLGIENYSSGGKDGRADTQILVTLNPVSNKMTMTSIPRDTRVYLDQIGQYNGYHKINATYTYGSITNYGGSKLAIETVENLLDIPIDKYIAVDFEGFRDIVDAFGGVTIDIKEGFWEENIYDHNKRIYFEQGPTHLSGEEALAFVRMRKRPVNASYPRDERQRQFIKSMIDEAISTDTLFKVNEISQIIGDNVETNLKPAEMYNLQNDYRSIQSSNIETFHINGTEQWTNGLFYFVPNTEELKSLSKQLRRELELGEEGTIGPE